VKFKMKYKNKNKFVKLLLAHLKTLNSKAYKLHHGIS